MLEVMFEERNKVVSENQKHVVAVVRVENVL